MRAAWLLAVAVAATAACGETSTPPVASGATAADSADQFIVGMQTNIHEGGLNRAKVLADTAYFMDDNTRLRMHGVSAEFYSSTGAADGRMNARVAHYNMRTQLLEAFGDVVVVNVEGRRLNTPHLIYDQALHQMSGDSAFTMTDAERTVEGIGFTTTPGLTTIRIGRNIRGTGGTVNLPDR